MTTDQPRRSESPPRILVTGAPRSGTTWIGRTLCLGGDVGEVYEPFNPRSRQWRWFDAPEFYLYIDESLEAPYVEPVGAMARWRYPLVRRLRAGDRRLALRSWSTARKHRRAGRGVLVKDPIALMSAPWLAHRFGFRPLVVIRHPAGFVSSLLRVGWRPRFGSWLRQPRLMDTLLAPWQEEIERAHRDDLELVEAGAVFWRVCAGVVTGYRAEHPDWVIVRHEDIARDPVVAYRDLYQSFGLTWSDAVAETIRAESAADNPREVAGGVQHGLQRDSRSVATIWQDRLTEQRVDTIRNIVGDVAGLFYDDRTWSAD
ncbi:MAG TPA: sulfotransferase [Mycobacteriales bacterium]|jgi:hypothetical protein|nr:sulfotransferase [Mycobacteriales bacterium]